MANQLGGREMLRRGVVYGVVNWAVWFFVFAAVLPFCAGCGGAVDETAELPPRVTVSLELARPELLPQVECFEVAAREVFPGSDPLGGVRLRVAPLDDAHGRFYVDAPGGPMVVIDDRAPDLWHELTEHVLPWHLYSNVNATHERGWASLSMSLRGRCY